MKMEQLSAPLLLQELTALLPAGVYAARACIGTVPPPLHRTEALAVAEAVPKRQREFAAGRAAARQALRAAGGTAIAIPVGADRAPQWPAGFCGSITHDDHWALAVAARTDHWRSLGLDLEDASPLEDDLIPLICTEAERARFDIRGASHSAKAIFSAKEAAFKAIYPLTGRMMSFHDIELLTLGEGAFEARLAVAHPPFARGLVMEGRQRICAGRLVSFVAFGQGS